MKTFKLIGFLLVAVLVFSCKSKLPESYHMDKRYWDVSDYDEAIRYIKYSLPKEEGNPRLTDPLTAPVFMKLVDKQNVSVVLDDNLLGLKHRNEVAEEFFKSARDIIEIYRALDNQDKFIYPIELVRAIEFGLHTQLLYFKVGNNAIVKDAVNPDNSDVKRVITSNEQTVANNFNIYLEILTKEDAFNEFAIKEYAKLIDIYFSKLIKEFPSADYSTIKNTAKIMNAKVKSPVLKKALVDLIDKIEKSNENYN